MLLLTSLTLGLQLAALVCGQQSQKPPFDLGNQTLEVVYNNKTLVSPPGTILGIDGTFFQSPIPSPIANFLRLHSETGEIEITQPSKLSWPEFLVSESAPTIGLSAPSLNGTYLLILVYTIFPFPQSLKATPYWLSWLQVDPDSSSPNVLHWLQTGLTASRQSIPLFNFLPFTSSTPPITPYARPRPPVGQGYHRYTFLLISQPTNFSIPTEFARIVGGTNRTAFDLARFLSVTGLGRTIASNYFLTANERSAASNATATAAATGTGTARSPTGKYQSFLSFHREFSSEGIVGVGIGNLYWQLWQRHQPLCRSEAMPTHKQLELRSWSLLFSALWHPCYDSTVSVDRWQATWIWRTKEILLMCMLMWIHENPWESKKNRDCSLF